MIENKLGDFLHVVFLLVVVCCVAQAPGILLHRLLDVLQRGAAGGGRGGSGTRTGAGAGTGGSGLARRKAGAEQCPPGVVEDLLAMMEQLGQVAIDCHGRNYERDMPPFDKQSSDAACPLLRVRSLSVGYRVCPRVTGPPHES